MADPEANPSGLDVPVDLPADATLSYRPQDIRDLESRAGVGLPGYLRADDGFLRLLFGREAKDRHLPRFRVAKEGPDSPGAEYIYQRLIAVGGHGEVWEATQASLDRRVAVKRLRAPAGPEGDSPSAAVRRLFEQEAVTAANLEHPNIVPVHDLGLDADGNPLLVMKQVRGRPWSEAILADQAVGVTEFLMRHLPILIQVGQAVAFAHSRGVIHRDLKPSQVMIGEFGEVVLMDWGLALYVGREPSEASTAIPDWCHGSLASASNPAGTPAFMAPEQTARSLAGVGPWTDVYLLGGILYFLLTGVPPHDDPDPLMAFHDARNGTVVPPQERRPDREMPQQLASLALRAMEADPSRRIAGAREFVAAIRDFLSGADARRESESIAGECASTLENPPSDYAGFLHILEALDRSRVLWPENPRVPGLRNLVAGGFARLALDSGDLVLARLHADQHSDPDSRTALLRDIEAAAARLKHQKALLRVSLTGVFLLILALLAGAGVHVRDQASARRKADAARVVAEAERRRAEAAREHAQQAQEEAVRQRGIAEREQYFAGIGYADANDQADRPAKVLEALLTRVPANLRQWEWGRLLARVYPDDMILTKAAEGRGLVTADFSPDGTRIVTGNRGAGANLWDAAKGTRLASWTFSSLGIWSLRFSPDGSRILVTQRDGTALIIGATDGKPRVRLTGAGGTGSFMRGGEFSPDGRLVATAGSDGVVRISDAASGNQLVTAKPPASPYDLAFSPDSARLAVSTVGAGQAVVLETTSGRQILTLAGHGRQTYGIAFSPDGQSIATACMDKHVRIFDAATGNLRIMPDGGESGFTDIAYNPDGKILAATTERGAIFAWNPVTGKQVAKLPGSMEQVGIRFHPRRNILLTTSYSETRLWDLDRLSSTHTGRIAPSQFHDLPLRTTLRVASFIYDRRFDWIHHDLPWLSDGGLTFFRGTHGGYRVESYYTAHSPAGQTRVDLGYTAFDATVVDTVSSRSVARLRDKKCFNAAFNRAGSILALATQVGELDLWDSATWKLRHRISLAETTSTIWGLCFSPDDRLLAATDVDGRVWLLNPETGLVAASRQVHERSRAATCLAFSPDGKTLASGSVDKTVRILELPTLREIGRLSGHLQAVASVAWSPDGRRLVTVGGEGNVKLWEPATGLEIMNVLSAERPERLVGATFSADGLAVVVANSKRELIELSAFPWNEAAYPGSGSTPFLLRLECLKRGERSGRKVPVEEVSWRQTAGFTRALEPANP